MVVVRHLSVSGSLLGSVARTLSLAYNVFLYICLYVKYISASLSAYLPGSLSPSLSIYSRTSFCMYVYALYISTCLSCALCLSLYEVYIHISICRSHKHERTHTHLFERIAHRQEGTRCRRSGGRVSEGADGAIFPAENFPRLASGQITAQLDAHGFEGIYQ